MIELKLWLFLSFVLVAMWVVILHMKTQKLARDLKYLEGEQDKLYVELQRLKRDTLPDLT